MQKECCRCHVTKPIGDFTARADRRDGRQSWCKPCTSARNREIYAISSERRSLLRRHRMARREAARQMILEFLESHPCVDCGEVDPVVLDFDHNDRSQKIIEVTEVPYLGWALDRLKAEIDKCTVRCANCHRRKTAKENNSWKLRATSNASAP